MLKGYAAHMQGVDGQNPLQERWNYLIAGAIGGIALLLQWAGPGATLALRYQRDAILNGEVWRLLTGQLVHLGWAHLLLNLVALALVTALFGQMFRLRDWAWMYAGAFLGTSLGLLAFNPDLHWYVGLSGALHGLFAAATLISLRRGERGAWLLLAALLVKLGWEQLAGSVPGSAAWIGGAVVTDAHLYGAMGGALTGWLLSRR